MTSACSPVQTGDFGARPADTFLVGRLRKTFRGQSSIGAIATSRSSSASDNQLFGVDAFLRFFEKLEVSSYLMRSDTPALEGKDLSTASRGRLARRRPDGGWRVTRTCRPTSIPRSGSFAAKT